MNMREAEAYYDKINDKWMLGNFKTHLHIWMESPWKEGCYTVRAAIIDFNGNSVSKIIQTPTPPKEDVILSSLLKDHQELKPELLKQHTKVFQTMEIS